MSIFDDIGDAFESGWNAVSDGVGTAYNGVTGVTQQIKDTIQNLGLDLAYLPTADLQWFVDHGNWLAPGWNLASDLVTSVTELPGSIADLAPSIAGPLVDFGHATLLDPAILNVLDDALTNASVGGFGLLQSLGDFLPNTEIRHAWADAQAGILGATAELRGLVHDAADQAMQIFAQLEGTAGGFVATAARKALLEGASGFVGGTNVLQRVIDRSLGELSGGELGGMIDNLITATVMPVINRAYFNMLSNIGDVVENVDRSNWSDGLRAAVSVYSSTRGLANVAGSVFLDLGPSFATDVAGAFKSLISNDLLFLAAGAGGNIAILGAQALFSITDKDLLILARLGVNQISTVMETATFTFSTASTAALLGMRLVAGHAVEVAATAGDLADISGETIHAFVAAGVHRVTTAGDTVRLSLGAIEGIRDTAIDFATGGARLILETTADELATRILLKISDLRSFGVSEILATGAVVLTRELHDAIDSAGLVLSSTAGDITLLLANDLPLRIARFVDVAQVAGHLSGSLFTALEFVERGGRFAYDAGASLSLDVGSTLGGVLATLSPARIGELLDAGITLFRDGFGDFGVILADSFGDAGAAIQSYIEHGTPRIFSAATRLALHAGDVDQMLRAGASFFTAAGHQIVLLGASSFDIFPAGLNNLALVGVTALGGLGDVMLGFDQALALAERGLKIIESGIVATAFDAAFLATIPTSWIHDLAAAGINRIVVLGVPALSGELLHAFTQAGIALTDAAGQGIEITAVGPFAAIVDALADAPWLDVVNLPEGAILDMAHGAALLASDVALRIAGGVTLAIAVTADTTLDLARATARLAEGVTFQVADGVMLAFAATADAFGKLTPQNFADLLEDGYRWFRREGELLYVMTDQEIQNATGETLAGIALRHARIYHAQGPLGLVASVLDKLAQYDTPLSGPLGFTAALVDTAATINALGVKTLASYAALGVVKLIANGDVPILDAEMAAALDKYGVIILANQGLVRLADRGEKLGALTATQIAHLAETGFTEVKTLDDLLLTPEQMQAFLESGLPMLRDWGRTIGVSVGTGLDRVVGELSSLPWLDAIHVTGSAALDLAAALELAASRVAVTVEGGASLTVNATASAVAALDPGALLGLLRTGFSGIYSGTKVLAQMLHGTADVDRLTGSAARDVFDLVAGGADIAVGKAGDDLFYLGAALDPRDRLDGGDGFDTVLLDGATKVKTGALASVEALAALSGGPGSTRLYDLALKDAAVGAGAKLLVDASGLLGGEALRFDGSDETDGSFDLRGGAGADMLRSGALADLLAGGLGDDTLRGDDGGDTLGGGGGKDSVSGEAGGDSLSGGDGADTLDGGTGADSLAGGPGDDLYIVDDSGDSIAEASGEGLDTVRSPISWTLGGNLEVLVLTGKAKTGTGNGLDNLVTGNNADNALGGSGGSDTLAGGDGDDTLDGGSDADSMSGGAGNDVYVVDNAGDTVIELAAGGRDAVRAGIDYVLGAELEDLTLTGAALNGTGNALNNAIQGNGNANLLSGLGGKDELSGGGGSDTLLGGLGADTLDGGGGADSLDGGAQGDLFRWLQRNQGNDTVAGFTTGVDKLGFSAAGFGGGLTDGVALTAAQYQSGAGSAAGSADVRFIYDSATGVLRFDIDGTGAEAARVIATFLPVAPSVTPPAIAASDFVIIA